MQVSYKNIKTHLCPYSMAELLIQILLPPTLMLHMMFVFPSLLFQGINELLMWSSVT